MASRAVRLRAALVLAALCTLLLSTSGRAATTITGLADQGTNQYWPTGAQVYAESMGAKFQHARFIVPWNVAWRPGSTDWNQMNDWYSYRVARGKTMLVSFNPYNGCREAVRGGATSCSPSPPSPASYVEAIQYFRRAWPQVREFTAWNEPNHSLKGDAYANGAWSLAEMNPVNDPNLAADYYWMLSSECRIDRGAGTCTAVAGDFSDGTSAMGSYPYTYKSRISSHGITPPVWAAHAYSAVNSNTPAWINEFFDRVRGTSPAWITEVGVKVCDSGLAYPSDATQTTIAQRLANLMSARNPARTYYYMLFGGQSASTCASGGSWDSGLLYRDPANPGLSTMPRAAMSVLFPELSGMYWGIRDQNTSGPAQRGFVFSGRGIPVVGDWNGDGIDTPGTYLNGQWRLRNSNTDGHADIEFGYGDDTMLPVVGDWNGDGIDTIGEYKPALGTWMLRNSNTPGLWDIGVQYGGASMKPIPGDWNGDGVDTIGVYDQDGIWFLRNSNTPGNPDVPTFAYGTGPDQPLAGNWDGLGIDDSIGIFSPYTYLLHLRDSLSSGSATVPPFVYGNPSDKRVVGDFNNDNVDTPAIVR